LNQNQQLDLGTDIYAPETGIAALYATGRVTAESCISWSRDRDLLAGTACAAGVMLNPYKVSAINRQQPCGDNHTAHTE
jgi:hypothetical protein